MEKQDVISALAALAQETRLDVFRRLVRAGPTGLAAGKLAKELAISPATLSFHLKELRNAGLLTSERQGRSIRYAPDFSVIRDVIAYLGENCCRDEKPRVGSRSRRQAFRTNDPSNAHEPQ